MKLKSRINGIESDKITAISKKYNLPSKISEIILSRIDYDDVDSFIFPDINSLFSPFEISTMQQVIDRIKTIKELSQKVVIYGDYDVDGITATSLMYKFLSEEGMNVDFYIPSRANGYGLTPKSVDDMIQKHNPDIVITVDCGITSYEEVSYIQSKGIEIIITDHHIPHGQLPDCLIVNPHIEPDLEFQDICGAGVAFKIIQGYYNNKKENYVRYLPIVAIGTIADVVPLIKDNRTMVNLGFSTLSFLPKGIKMLLSCQDISPTELNSQTIAYKLAPMLNSVGRLKSADIAVKVFISEDDEELERLCFEIIETNKERQRITEEIFAESEKQILSDKIPSAIVLKNSDWDAGVIGIVASKILDRYKRTTILFTESNGVLKGSCRSVEGINIFNELMKVSEYIVQFGGHEKAAGLTVEADKFEDFKRAITHNIGQSMKEIDLFTYYDTEISPEEIDHDFAKKLSVLEPFGECNPLPVFLLDTQSAEIENFKNTDKHITIKYGGLKLKYFNASVQKMNYRNFTSAQNLVKVSLSYFNGYELVNIICDNALFFNLKRIYDKSIRLNKYRILMNNIKFSQPEIVSMDSLRDSDNFIICTYDYENFKQLERFFGDSVTYTSGSVAMAEKRKNVCFAPENPDELKNFEKVYFTERRMAYFAKNAEKYLIFDNFNDIPKQTMTRERLAVCYLAIKDYISSYSEKENTIENFDAEKLYHSISLTRYSSQAITIEEFMYALLILEEREIINYVDNNFVITGKKANLAESNLLNFD